MKKAYVATIQVLVTNVRDSDDACDAVSAVLTDKCAPDPSIFVDWAYLSIGGQLLSPSETLIDDDYQEGDFL